MLNEKAVKLACKIIAQFEGCCLYSYPDPASPLYEALSRNGMLSKYMKGALKWKDLPANFKLLSGTPFTIGYGSTRGVKNDTAWTQAQADEALEREVREFMEGVLKTVPSLGTLSAEKITACTSLAYNIGLAAFKTSTVVKKIAIGDMHGAAQAFHLWNKASGRVLQGLVNRRKIEADLFLSE